MMEAAIVFDNLSRTLWAHLPPGRSAGGLPDSRDLWEVLWAMRHVAAGVAHLHPWEGQAVPSHEDLTTFSAVDRALGLRLYWPVVTLDNCAVYRGLGVGSNYQLDLTAGACYHRDRIHTPLLHLLGGIKSW